MIKLKVAYYCHDCPRFRPNVIERPQLGKLTSYDTVIACVDRARCEMVYKRISEAMEESND